MWLHKLNCHPVQTSADPPLLLCSRTPASGRACATWACGWWTHPISTRAALSPWTCLACRRWVRGCGCVSVPRNVWLAVAAAAAAAGDMHIIVERMHHTLLGGIAYRSCRQFCSPPCWVVRGLQLKLHGTGHLIIPPHVPQLPPHYNEWNENEDMVAFHLEAIHQQVCAAETPAACKGTDTLEGGCAVLGVGVCVKRRACQPLHHAAVWRI